ncbi:MAG: molybdate ABC transporter substrate-binding protein [Clostridia bacterium]|jgi:molybdate transport system substrate-binding protein|nr:molybdate ABC transporter substrate-binding protein [Clostridia bacterium]
MMKGFQMGREFVVILLMMMFVLALVPGAAFAAPGIAVDGQALSIDASYGAPYIDSANRLQVPIRVVSEKLGAKVDWDQNTQTATINGNLKIKLGSAEIQTPLGAIAMDTSAVLKDGRIYVPIRFIANALGYKINAATISGNTVGDIVTKAELTISAAASLKDAFAELETLYKAVKPNTTLAVNLAGSGALQQQIEQGANVDVFFSAATSNMNTLKDKGLMDDVTIKNMLRNRLVLVVPNDSKLTIDAFAKVTDAAVKKIALGEPKSVPAGKYAEDVFTKLGILDQVKAKVVYAKDVREVLTWVETGNVDAGAVYSTDAKSSDKVKIVADAPADSHTPIIYPAGVVKASKSPEAARDFLIFLGSEAAKTVFEKYGFVNM